MHLAFGDGDLWTLDMDNGEALALSTEDGRIVRRLDLSEHEPKGIGWYDGLLVISSAKGKSHLLFVDPANGAVIRRIRNQAPTWGTDGVARVQDKLWVSASCWMTAVDPETEVGTKQSYVGAWPFDMASRGDTVWQIDRMLPGLIIQSDAEGKLKRLTGSPFFTGLTGNHDQWQHNMGILGIAHDGRNLWALATKDKQICVISRSRDADATWRELFAPEAMAQWVPADLQIEDGVLDAAGKQWVGHEEQLRNFILECDFLFRQPGRGQGGIVLRGDRGSSTSWLSGYELDIDGAADDMGHVHFPCYPQPHSGEIRFERGQWQHLRVEARDDTFTVALNGRKGIEFKDDRFRYGQISLEGSPVGVKYRNLRIQNLDDEEPGGRRSPWADLYDGKGANGWHRQEGTLKTAANRPMLIGQDGQSAAVVWQGKPIAAESTVEFNVWRKGTDPRGYYDLILKCDAEKPLASGIHLICYRGRVDAFFKPGNGKPAQLLGTKEIEPTKWPEQWRFVMAKNRIDCYRFGNKLMTAEFAGATSAGIAMATHGDRLEVRRVSVRADQE